MLDLFEISYLHYISQTSPYLNLLVFVKSQNDVYE